jgi:hypothetical protein
LLGKRFTALQLRRGARRTEARNARLLQRVGKPRDQRRFGTDHHKVNRVLAGELHQVGNGFGGDGHAFRDLGNPCVARRGVERVAEWALAQFPRQRVFPSAAAHQQHAHLTA